MNLIRRTIHFFGFHGAKNIKHYSSDWTFYTNRFNGVCKICGREIYCYVKRGDWG